MPSSKDAVMYLIGLGNVPKSHEKLYGKGKLKSQPWVDERDEKISLYDSDDEKAYKLRPKSLEYKKDTYLEPKKERAVRGR